MKTLLTTSTAILLIAHLHAQNVGIGTTSPQSKLHIAQGGDGITDLTIENTRKIEEVGYSRTRILFKHEGMHSGDITLMRDEWGKSAFQLNLNHDNKLIVLNNGNVGIGTTSPNHKLEVEGTMRVSGNMGVGVSMPTATLDVAGSLRYRGSGFPNLPKPGAVLTSMDDDGDAQWQRPVVFKTKGMLAGQNIPKNEWTKIVFKTNAMELNEGLYFDVNLSTFSAPAKGAYHFDATINMSISSCNSNMRIVVYRDGAFLKDIYVGQAVCSPCGENDEDFYTQLRGFKRRNYTASGIFYLEQNDKVWIEAMQGDNEGYMQVNPSSRETWFSGSLLYRL